MTRKEIEARMKDIENTRFYLNMIDNWTTKDFDLDRKLANEYRELKNMLK